MSQSGSEPDSPPIVSQDQPTTASSGKATDGDMDLTLTPIQGSVATLQPTYVVEYEWAKRLSQSTGFYRLLVVYVVLFVGLTGPMKAVTGPACIVASLPTFFFWFVLLSRQNRRLMKLLLCNFEFLYLVLLVVTHVTAKCIALVPNKRGRDIHQQVALQISFVVGCSMCLTWDGYAQRVPPVFRNWIFGLLICFFSFFLWVNAKAHKETPDDHVVVCLLDFCTSTDQLEQTSRGSLILFFAKYLYMGVTAPGELMLLNWKLSCQAGGERAPSSSSEPVIQHQDLESSMQSSAAVSPEVTSAPISSPNDMEGRAVGDVKKFSSFEKLSKVSSFAKDSSLKMKNSLKSSFKSIQHHTTHMPVPKVDLHLALVPVEGSVATLQPRCVVEYKWAKFLSESDSFYKLLVLYVVLFAGQTITKAVTGPMAIALTAPGFFFWFVLLSRQNSQLMKLLLCNFEFLYLVLLVTAHVTANCIALVPNKRGMDVHTTVGNLVGFFGFNLALLSWDGYAQRIPSTVFSALFSAFVVANIMNLASHAHHIVATPDDHVVICVLDFCTTTDTLDLTSHASLLVFYMKFVYVGLTAPGEMMLLNWKLKVCHTTDTPQKKPSKKKSPLQDARRSQTFQMDHATDGDSDVAVPATDTGTQRQQLRVHSVPAQLGSADAATDTEPKDADQTSQMDGAPDSGPDVESKADAAANRSVVDIPATLPSDEHRGVYISEI
jgi:hypothetical protein